MSDEGKERLGRIGKAIEERAAEADKRSFDNAREPYVDPKAIPWWVHEERHVQYDSEVRRCEHTTLMHLTQAIRVRGYPPLLFLPPEIFDAFYRNRISDSHRLRDEMGEFFWFTGTQVRSYFRGRIQFAAFEDFR